MKSALPTSETFHKEDCMRLKVWIFLVSVVFAGLLLLANFVAVVLYVALILWK